MEKNKKKLKTLIAILCCMAIAMLVVPNVAKKEVKAAEADTVLAIKTSATEVNTGDTVSVTVSLDKNPGIAGLSYVLLYDTNVLEFVSSEGVNDVLSGPTVNKDTKGRGRVGYSFAAADATSGTGNIMKVTFKVKDGAAVGESAFGFDKLDGTISLSETDIKAAVVEGKVASIKVLCKHTSTKEVVNKAATCTEKGEKITVCNTCGETIKREEIAALGHDLGEYVVTKAATCTEKGNKTATCKREGCGVTDVQEIAALGHDFGEYVVTKEATCTEKGNKTATCMREGCGAKDVQEIPALGHTFDSYEIVKEPTTEEDGEIKRICSVCNESVASSIPKLDAKNFRLKDEKGDDLKDSYSVNNTLKFSAVIYRVNISDKEQIGDIRYVPVSYEANGTSSEWDKGPFTSEIELNNIGECKITVIYAREIFTKDGWVKDDNTFSNETVIKVVEEDKKDDNTNDSKDDDKKNDTNDSVNNDKKNDTNNSVSNDKNDSTDKSGSSKNDVDNKKAPKTGDSGIKVMLLCGLAVIAATEVLISMNKKKNENK